MTTPKYDPYPDGTAGRIFVDDPYDLEIGLLSKMWNEQYGHWLQEWARYGKPEDLNDLHLKLCRHLQGEVDELVRCADWKIHQRGSMANQRSITFECVDVFKFLLTLLILHDVSPITFFKAFMEKSLVVKRRVWVEHLKALAAKGRPMLLCDLDGVLCDRDVHLLGYANAKHPGSDSVSAWKRAHGQRAYEMLKAEFYESGGFQRVPPKSESIEALREAKAPVLILTSRDIKRFPHLEYETYKWLDEQGVPYLGVVFASEKERAVLWVPPTSVAIDDEQEHLDKLSLVCYDGGVFKYRTAADLQVAVARVNDKIKEYEHHA